MLNPPSESTAPPRRRIFSLLRKIGLVLGILFLVLLVAAGALWWYLNPAVSHEERIIYGERNGRDLTYDIITPASGGNGRGILFMVSGSWKSRPGSVRPWLVAPLLRQGFTVYAVCHLSQPEATVMDIVADIERAVRHIRHGAAARGIDPDRLGISGGSSGGHLSLMLATRGGPGDPAATDPIDRESSAVQAAAVFFPVTDLLNLGDSTENLHDGGPPKSYKKAFGPDTDQVEVWQRVGRGVSPIYHIPDDMPPVLIFHGDADTLVPLDQSIRFREAAATAGHEVELVVREGKNHGWLSMILDIRTFGQWYAEKLR